MNQLAESPVVAAPTAAAQAEPDGPSTAARALLWAAERGIVVFTAVLILASVLFVDGFASAVNIADVFHRAAPIGIVAVGMTFVVISGNYLDLSVVAQVATGAVILIGVSNSHSIPLAILLALAVSVVYGLVNGDRRRLLQGQRRHRHPVDHLRRPRSAALAVGRQHLLRPQGRRRSRRSATSRPAPSRSRRSCWWWWRSSSASS